MADILSGASGHSSFAPLSQAQTIEICQHLSELISQLQEEIANLHARHDTNEDAIANLRGGLGSSNAMISDLKSGLTENSNAIESTRADVGRNFGKTGGLHATLQNAQESIEALRQAQKITNTFVQKLTGDLQRNDDLTNSVREDIERRLGTNFEKLQDQVGRLDLKLNQLTEYDELDKVASQEQKEVGRLTDEKVRNLKDESIRTNTMLAMLEARLTDRGNGMKENTKNLEDTKGLMLRMSEDYEHMKGSFAELQLSCKQMGLHVGQVSEDLDVTSRTLKDVTGRLDSTVNGLDTARQTIDLQKGNLQSLQESHVMAHQSIRNLSENLADTHATAHQVKVGLKETQAIVLPNLKMGGGAADPASQTTIKTPRAPLGPKGASGGMGIRKVDRGINLGSATNSLAWI